MAQINSGSGASHDELKEVIETVLHAELDRQAHDGASRIDVSAMAEAVETALEGEVTTPSAPLEEGKTPDQLNSTNDD